jgi:hypothetical protein
MSCKGDVLISVHGGDLFTANMAKVYFLASGTLNATPAPIVDPTQGYVRTYLDNTGIPIIRLSETGITEYYDGTDWLPLPISADSAPDLMTKTASNSNIDKLKFDLTPSTDALNVGEMRYNSTDDTIDLKHNDGVTQQIGQEIYASVVNKTGDQIGEGLAVYPSGKLGKRQKIALAQGNVEATSNVLGVTTHVLNNNEEGKVTTFGEINGIKTNYAGWDEGDVIYLSKTTAGALTNVAPTAPCHCDIIGIVGIIHPTDGSLFVNIQRHMDLTSLADVNGTPLTTSGQILVWNQTLGVFDFTDNINNKLSKTTNITSIDDTGIADGEIMVANLTGKKIETSNVLIGDLATNVNLNKSAGLVASYEVTTTGISQVDFTGLDILADGGKYEVIISGFFGYDNSYAPYMYVNADYTETNYKNGLTSSVASNARVGGTSNLIIGNFLYDYLLNLSKPSIAPVAVGTSCGYSSDFFFGSTIRWTYVPSTKPTNITSLHFKAYHVEQTTFDDFPVGIKIAIYKKGA